MIFPKFSSAQSFLQSQLLNERVKASYEEKGKLIGDLLKSKGLEKKPFQVFIRAFKEEKNLEVWIKSTNSSKFTLLKTYEIAASSGILVIKGKKVIT